KVGPIITRYAQPINTRWNGIAGIEARLNTSICGLGAHPVGPVSITIGVDRLPVNIAVIQIALGVLLYIGDIRFNQCAGIRCCISNAITTAETPTMAKAPLQPG